MIHQEDTAACSTESQRCGRICWLGSESAALISDQHQEMPLQSGRGSVFPQLDTYMAARDIQKMRLSIDCWEPRVVVGRRGNGINYLALKHCCATELPAQSDSDTLGGDTYHGSAASAGIGRDKKFFTGSKAGRSRKERFRYWTDLRNPVSKAGRTEWAQVTQLLPNWHPGLEERWARGSGVTYVPDAAPGRLSEHPGASAPITVLGSCSLGRLKQWRSLDSEGFIWDQDFPSISARTQEESIMMMAVQVSCGSHEKFLFVRCDSQFVLYNISSMSEGDTYGHMLWKEPHLNLFFVET